MKTACKKLDFPAEAIEMLEECHQALLADGRACTLLQEAQEHLFAPESRAFLDCLQRVAEITGQERYTVNMVFLLLSLAPLREKYVQKGLPEELMWETMHDLTYKLHECHAVYGIWGTFVTAWYKNLYGCTCFKLGRLEFERGEFELALYKDIVKKGDSVVHCHIPSAKEPLSEAAVLDSLRRAYDFFPEARHDGVLVVACHSWLLYPPHYDLFPEGGNMRRFYELFDVVESGPESYEEDFWRIYHCPYDAAILDTVPTDTSLRRNFLPYLRAGNPMGAGAGVLLFDGEKVL